jgi:hypothetical protein
MIDVVPHPRFAIGPENSILTGPNLVSKNDWRHREKIDTLSQKLARSSAIVVFNGKARDLRLF